MISRSKWWSAFPPPPRLGPQARPTRTARCRSNRHHQDRELLGDARLQRLQHCLIPCPAARPVLATEHLADHQGKLLCLITVSLEPSSPRGPIYRGRRGLP